MDPDIPLPAGNTDSVIESHSRRHQWRKTASSDLLSFGQRHSNAWTTHHWRVQWLMVSKTHWQMPHHLRVISPGKQSHSPSHVSISQGGSEVERVVRMESNTVAAPFTIHFGCTTNAANISIAWLSVAGVEKVSDMQRNRALHSKKTLWYQNRKRRSWTPHELLMLWWRWRMILLLSYGISDQLTTTTRHAVLVREDPVTALRRRWSKIRNSEKVMCAPI